MKRPGDAAETIEDSENKVWKPVYKQQAGRRVGDTTRRETGQGSYLGEYSNLIGHTAIFKTGFEGLQGVWKYNLYFLSKQIFPNLWRILST